MRKYSGKLFLNWTSGSGGDVVLRYFLSRALTATLFGGAVESIMGNISVKIFGICTSGSEGDVV